MSKAKLKTSVADRILNRLGEFTADLEKSSSLSRKYTCRKVSLDLEPTNYNASEVIRVRELLGLSQPLFAKYLGVSVKTVRAWEQGLKVPAEMACRFMDEIRNDPKHYRDRLTELLIVRK